MSSNYLIEDAKVGLRFLRDADRERFYFLQQDEQINRFIRASIPNQDVEKRFQILLKPWQEIEREFHGLVLCEKPQNELQGLMWYQYRDKKHHIIEIGWKVHPDIEGNGYATRASILLMNYLKMNYPVHKFIARCDSENKASERIMQKIGMRLEVNAQANFKIGDEWRNEIGYGLVVEQILSS